jgi:hypothetical protein
MDLQTTKARAGYHKSPGSPIDVFKERAGGAEADVHPIFTGN